MKAETRCSQSRKQTPSSRAAKETTKKEKWVRKKLGTKMSSKKATSRNLRIVTEQWLDKLCYKVKLEKYIEKHNQKKHNIMFQGDQKGFFRTLEAVEKCEGETPKMQRFAEFWGGIWG